VNHGRKGAQLLGMDRLPSTPPAIAAGALCLQLPRMCCCRHHAALVSRRWYAAAHVPDVLRSISSYGSTPARLPSLAAWLLRHGRHMQSFGLFCHKGNSDAGLFAWELSACLGPLATASSLQQLRVHFNCAGTALRITSWCAALRQLQFFWPQAVGGTLPNLLDHKAQMIAEAARRLRLSTDRASSIVRP